MRENNEQLIYLNKFFQYISLKILYIKIIFSELLLSLLKDWIIYPSLLYNITFLFTSSKSFKALIIFSSTFSILLIFL